MKRIIFLSFLVLTIFSVYNQTNQYAYIPNSAIRLRVIPNSNNKEDIYIKEEVKNYLENNLYQITKDIDDIEEARTIINDSIPSLKDNIDNIFTRNNYSLPYDINYGYNYFPQKEYKGITYDEGYYESLVISIGEANGDNWWCVLFPNFCLIDSKPHEYKSFFKELMSK